MAEMHTNSLRDDSAVILWNLSVFLLRSVRVEIFPSLFNFSDAHAIPRGHTSHQHVVHRHSFFKHATHAIYAVFQLGNMLATIVEGD